MVFIIPIYKTPFDTLFYASNVGERTTLIVIFNEPIPDSWLHLLYPTSRYARPYIGALNNGLIWWNDSINSKIMKVKDLQAICYGIKVKLKINKRINKTPWPSSINTWSTKPKIIRVLS